MGILEPNWSQQKPGWRDAAKMCSEIELTPLAIQSESFDRALNRLKATHSNGGAFLKAVRVGESEVFDWFASRNRLLEDEILPSLLRRAEIRQLMPELLIPMEAVVDNEPDTCSIASSGGFKFDSPFLFDGQLAQCLFAGGAYPSEEKIDGKGAKRQGMNLCDAMFGQRYEDVCLFSSYEAWTPWFGGIAWDWTAVLFDKRERALWILAVTDTD